MTEDVKDLAYYENNPDELPVDDPNAVEALLAEMDGDPASVKVDTSDDGSQIATDKDKSNAGDQATDALDKSASSETEDQGKESNTDDHQDGPVPLQRHIAVTKNLRTELDTANQKSEDLLVQNARLEERLKINAPSTDDSDDKPGDTDTKTDDPFVKEYGLSRAEYEEEFGEDGLKVAVKAVELEARLNKVESNQEQQEKDRQADGHTAIEQAIKSVPELQAVLDQAFAEGATRQDRLAWENALSANQMLIDEDATYQSMSLEERFAFLAKDLGFTSKETPSPKIDPGNLPTPTTTVPNSVSEIPSSVSVMEETEAQKALNMTATEMDALMKSDPERFERLLEMTT